MYIQPCVVVGSSRPITSTLMRSTTSPAMNGNVTHPAVLPRSCISMRPKSLGDGWITEPRANMSSPLDRRYIALRLPRPAPSEMSRAALGCASPRSFTRDEALGERAMAPVPAGGEELLPAACTALLLLLAGAMSAQTANEARAYVERLRPLPPAPIAESRATAATAAACC